VLLLVYRLPYNDDVVAFKMGAGTESQLGII